jgi:hypothetical protein
VFLCFNQVGNIERLSDSTTSIYLPIGTHTYLWGSYTGATPPKIKVLNQAMAENSYDFLVTGSFQQGSVYLPLIGTCPKLWLKPRSTETNEDVRTWYLETEKMNKAEALLNFPFLAKWEYELKGSSSS